MDDWRSNTGLWVVLISLFSLLDLMTTLVALQYNFVELNPFAASLDPISMIISKIFSVIFLSGSFYLASFLTKKIWIAWLVMNTWIGTIILVNLYWLITPLL